MLRVPSPRRLLIVEEALRSLHGGHWCQYLGTIARGCRAGGVEVTIAAHRDVEEPVRQALGALPVLRFSAWDRSTQSPSALVRHAQSLRHNLRLYRDASQFARQHGPFDVVLAPTILPQHVLGWTLFARRVPTRVARRTAMIFVNTPGRWQADGPVVFPKSSNFMRSVLRWAAPLHRSGRLTFTCETARAAQQFELFCGLPFALVPHPVDFPSVPGKLDSISASSSTSPPSVLRPPSSAPSSLTFASLGFPRHEKGSELLQAAAVRHLASPAGAGSRFIIQWVHDYMGPGGVRMGKEPRLQADSRVEFLDQALTPEDYNRMLARADVMVLPYRQESYYDRVSRLAIESACLGIPMIYPARCWLADLVQRCGAGIVFRSGDGDDLARALNQAREAFAPLKAQAVERVATARACFDPVRFQKLLFGEPDDLAAFAF